jgi:dolichol-phosphate mannosyltransferase
VRGQSKLSFKEQLRYIQHVRRLYIHRFEHSMNLLQFLVVGASGVAVNLAVLSLMLFAGFAQLISIAGGLVVSLVTNFLLNRRFTFSYARHGNIGRQFAGYLGASFIGMAVNYAVAAFLLLRVLPDLAYGPHVAALAGITCGMGFNYLGNRFMVFRRKFYRPYVETAETGEGRPRWIPRLVRGNRKLPRPAA